MKNVVECQKEFFAYFNALETQGGFSDVYTLHQYCEVITPEKYNRCNKKELMVEYIGKSALPLPFRYFYLQCAMILNNCGQVQKLS